MNRFAILTLSGASLLMLIMAVLVDSPPLFFMSTAVLLVLAMTRLQAWLAVRWLRFERSAPPAVRVGEPVSIDITIWSEKKLQRPLVTIADGLPKRLVTQEMTPSLPVAPSFDQPIRTRYSFRPMRRGRFEWNKLTVYGTDALGLVTLSNEFRTDPIQLTVYPAPLPVSIELTPVAGWGTSDLESGKTRGAGLEPRGIREYSPGDPMRYVHWASSARAGKLLVKEFDSGSGTTIEFLLQRGENSDIGTQDSSTLEAMCGHCLFLASEYVNKGAHVFFPAHEPAEKRLEHPEARLRDLREVLTDIVPTQRVGLAQELDAIGRAIHPGSTLILMMAVQEPALPDRLAAMPDVQRVALVYDAAEYTGGSALPWGIKSAADPLYMARLENAGVQVILMPKVEKIG